MRMQIESWRGIGIINDAYNANPGIDEGRDQNAGRNPMPRPNASPCWATCLSSASTAARSIERLGKQLARAGIDRLYLLGEQAAEVRKGALRAGMKPEQIIIGEITATLASRSRAHVKRGDWLLFKGSRGMKMETVF